MKTIIMTILLAFSGFAVADMDGDMNTMLRYAGEAVHDHGIEVVGMTPGAVRVSYSHSTRRFTATDMRRDCSFQAKVQMSYRRLESGHHWRVIEIPGTNTCY